jgi:hypothetical protein
LEPIQKEEESKAVEDLSIIQEAEEANEMSFV